jgi:hypothetical protein
MSSPSTKLSKSPKTLQIVALCGFLVLVSGAPVLAQFGNPEHAFHTVWRGTWRSGWTSFAPFQLGGQAHVLSYMSSSGRVDIDRFNPDGKGTVTVWPPDAPAAHWNKGWTTILPLHPSSFILSYRQGNGVLHLDEIDSGGQGTTTRWKGNLSPGLRLAVLTLGSTNYLLRYAPDGWAYIYRLDIHNPPRAQVWGEKWTPGWTSLVPFQLDGGSYLLSYNGSNGRVDIDRFYLDGAGKEQMSRVWPAPGQPYAYWKTGWTSFAPFQAAGQTYLLSYMRGSERVEIDRFNLGGKGTTTVYPKDGDAVVNNGWTSVVSFQLNNRAHFLLYGKDPWPQKAGFKEVHIYAIND